MRQSLIKFIFRLTGFLLVFGFHQLATAAMYKWVDEEGVTHYTQQPPPDGIQAETLKPPPKVDTDAAIEKLDSQQKQVEELREGRLKGKEEEMKKAEEAALQKENCRKATEKLSSLERPRVNLVNEDGSYTRVTEEYRQEQMEIAKERVKEFCN